MKCVIAEDLEPIAEHDHKEAAPDAQVEEEEEVVEEAIIPRSPKMDTDGKPIGRLLGKRER